MKILFDTSALFPGLRHPELPEQSLGVVIEEGHIPVVTDYILDELRLEIQKKYTHEQAATALDLLLQILSRNVFEVKLWNEYAPYLDAAAELVPAKDTPVLATLMLPDVTHLVTADKKDFLDNEALHHTSWREHITTPAGIVDVLMGRNNDESRNEEAE